MNYDFIVGIGFVKQENAIPKYVWLPKSMGRNVCFN